MILLYGAGGEPGRGETPMRSLLSEADAQKPYKNEMLITTLQSMLISYARTADGIGDEPLKTPASARNENQILDNAVQYIAGGTRRRLTVNALARLCSVSPSYLSLLFRRHLGIAPAAYMLRVRLEESRGLIRGGSGNMNEIAALLCFSSAQHFSTAFRKQYGISPTAYAKSLR